MLPLPNWFGTVFRRKQANHAQPVFLIGADGAPLSMTAAVAATDTFTWDQTPVVTGATVTINGRVYTARTALTVPAVVNEVLLLTGGDDFLLNLIRALNHTGTEGTDYSTGTLQNADVSAATSVTSHAFAVSARNPGEVGNSITVATSSAHLAWTTTALTGGVNAVLDSSVSVSVTPTASELVLGKTVGVSKLLTATPVLSVAGAYATGDYVGTTTTPQAFLLASRVSGNTAFIKSLAITNKVATAMVAMELWVFSATFTAPTDNAAWAITDADQLNCLGVIPIPTTKWYTNSNGQVFSDDTLSLCIKPAVTSLFFALVIRGTYTFTDGDLQLSLGILQD